MTISKLQTLLATNPEGEEAYSTQQSELIRLTMLARVFRNLRLAHDMTVEEVSNAINKTAIDLVAMEFGNKPITVPDVYELSALYQVDPIEVLNLVDQAASKLGSLQIEQP